MKKALEAIKKDGITINKKERKKLWNFILPDKFKSLPLIV